MKSPSREPYEWEKSRALQLPAAASVLATSRQRRAEAFSGAPDFVLSTQVLPITPRTISMLLAVGNRFVVGGQPAEGDVRNFIWFHSPLYANCTARDWVDRKHRALKGLTDDLTQPWRRWLLLRPNVDRYAAVLALAIMDVSRLMGAAFADAPPSGRSRSRPPIATLEAQLVCTFSSALGWPASETRNTPLSQLFQILRCVQANRGGEVYDSAEDDLLADHLTRRNQELAEIRDRQSPQKMPA